MEERKAGVCGKNVTWEFDEKIGKLTVSGVGPMEEFKTKKSAPWFSLTEQIKEIEVKEGVTNVSDYAFHKCVNAEKIILPSTAEVYGYHCLSFCTSLKELILPEGARVLESRAFDSCKSLEKIHLPLSIRAIDMKCFPGCTSLKEVIYAGTEEAWNKIRLSTIGDGNTLLFTAPRTYEGKTDPMPEETEADRIWHREKEEVVPILDIVADILKKGGDGRLHILAFENRIEGPNHELIIEHQKSGDALLIVFPDGKTMMLDYGVPLVEPKMMKAIKRLGITSLDHMVSSHTHHDHTGNGLAVAKYIYENGGKVGAYHHVTLRLTHFETDLRDYLEEQGTEMYLDSLRGKEMEIGGVKIEFHGPTEERVVNQLYKKEAGDVNNISIIMKFVYGKSSYITSGDLFRPYERVAAAELGDKLKADVMKANHHGIITSNSDEWVNAVDPKLVIACHDDIGSTSNSEKFKAAGREYFTTGLNGAILVSLSEDGSIEAKTEYGDTWKND